MDRRWDDRHRNPREHGQANRNPNRCARNQARGPTPKPSPSHPNTERNSAPTPRQHLYSARGAHCDPDKPHPQVAKAPSIRRRSTPVRRPGSLLRASVLTTPPGRVSLPRAWIGKAISSGGQAPVAARCREAGGRTPGRSVGDDRRRVHDRQPPLLRPRLSGVVSHSWPHYRHRHDAFRCGHTPTMSADYRPTTSLSAVVIGSLASGGTSCCARAAGEAVDGYGGADDSRRLLCLFGCPPPRAGPPGSSRGPLSRVVVSGQLTGR